MSDELQLVSLKKLKKYPEFEKAANKVKKAAIKRASDIWPGYTFGGMFPKGKQFGITTALPKFFKGYEGTQLDTFKQRFGSAGWQDIFNMTVDEDIILAGIGFGITSPSVNITELRMEIEDTKYPRINIEEMRTFETPTVMFRQGWIAQEEQSFKLRGYIENAPVHQRVIPVASFALYKKKADVIKE